jgi:membrane protease YdiL (CAAX protease family)
VEITRAGLESESEVRPYHRWGLGAFVAVELLFLISSVVVVVLLDPSGTREKLGPNALVVALMLPSLLAAALAVVITQVRGNGPAVDLGLRWRWSDVSWGVAVGLPGLGLTLLAVSLWTRFAGPHATSAVGSLLDGLHLPVPLAVLIFLHIWLVAPVCEEIIYRGLLWGAMERLRWSRWTALALSTGIFAVAHLEPSRTLLLLVIGIPIGMARLITGGLTASIVAHQINNFLPALGILLISLGVMPA